MTREERDFELGLEDHRAPAERGSPASLRRLRVHAGDPQRLRRLRALGGRLPALRRRGVT